MPSIPQKTKNVFKNRSSSVPFSQILSELVTFQQQHECFKQAQEELALLHNGPMTMRASHVMFKKLEERGVKITNAMHQSPLKDLIVQHSIKSKIFHSPTRVQDDFLIFQVVNNQGVTKLNFAPHPHSMPKQSKLKTKRAPHAVFRTDLNLRDKGFTNNPNST